MIRRTAFPKLAVALWLAPWLSLGYGAVAWAQTQQGWEKVSSEDGITVYQKDSEDSEVISIRGEALVDASPRAIFEIMKNPKIADEWMPMVAERRELQRISPTERIEYTHIEMPWPLTDRYFVNRGKAVFGDGGVIKISTRSENPPPFKDEDKVLGQLHFSQFVLTPQADGEKTHVTLEINSDPKGLIPKFLVNMAQRSWPVDFFHGLERMLKKYRPLSH